ncbi:putative efflux pump protein [Apodospora peruviana]|uniref:Efflux pump protein n=1 Tax=Apodospora peruviana TaxID=516989 RepID=A0AAE0ITL9_9PEZI|nr:putative efflux pump protein [Apodospora peruviana]
MEAYSLLWDIYPILATLFCVSHILPRQISLMFSCLRDRGAASQTSSSSSSETGTGNASNDTIMIDQAQHPELGHAAEMGSTASIRRRLLAFTALAFMWSAAQAPLFLFAGAPVYIYKELGGVDHWVWLASANLLATAAISPFVGTLSDIFGRRYVAISGSVFLVIGAIVSGTAHKMDVFIGGMALSGIGTGINELTALAGTAEIVPVSGRGYYIAAMVLSVLPFTPSVMWAQLISHYSTWRYISILTGGWAFVGLVLTILFYSPPRTSSAISRKIELLKKIDFVGGIMSIAGLAFFEIAILGGGYNFPWSSPQCLAPLILGLLFMLAFAMWEVRYAVNPMVPRRLGKAPRTLMLTLIITFISGANFFSVLMLWPGQAYNVYGHDPVGVGLRGLPFAVGVLAGCFTSLVLLSKFRGNIKWLLFGASVLMTAGCGGLAGARVDNIEVVYFILLIAGLGVGGIVVPASTITTIICPADLIATITALTISIRIVGGAIGYAVYYNVFVNKLVPELTTAVAGACVQTGIRDRGLIGNIIGLTATSLIDEIRNLPGVTESGWVQIVAAGKQTYANVYSWVYYCSVAFGGVSIIASLFLEDIAEFIDDNVAVVL